ncbi:PaaI family thioesterase [Oceanospirillum sanctuarii]|uniref:PaaI family thioesterase n=1 Tax=Oceanospirillum sanctuarii TaxID=1434821 RepID=UPI001FE5AFCD|nr:PaaI family thioesterase [Oceanospirillum sanctuarii]
MLESAPFIQALGMQAETIKPGICTTQLFIRQDHQQQDGFVHAGVQATLCDHTAGAAGATLIAEGKRVLTAEFKINLLRPASGEHLICEAEVLKPGNTLSIVESMLWAVRDDQKTLVAKATVTLAIA